MPHNITQALATLRSSQDRDIKTLAGAMAELHNMIVQLQAEVAKLKSAVSQSRDDT